MSPTTVLTVPEGKPPPTEAVQRAVEALEGGHVIGLPTETVYVLAARADDRAALQKLASLGSGASSPALYLPDERAVPAGAALPRLTERLRDRYWPGPLTLILRPEGDATAFSGLDLLAQDGWTGVRAPAHPVARAILAAAPFPVAAIGAGVGPVDPAKGPAEEPSGHAEALRVRVRDGSVPLVIDAGPAALGQASTRLAVGPGRFEVVREGIVTEAELRRAAGLSILFVCTGNTCRSPMAEALARRAIRTALGAQDEASFGFEVTSAGVFAGPGSPASENSIRALDELDVDLSGHRSRPTTPREVASRDRVFCLTRSHRDALLAMLPPSAAGAVELLDPQGGDLADPFGGPLEVYRATRDAIAACVDQRVRDWV